MVPIDLFDDIELYPITVGVRLSCRGFDVPEDESNLVHKAARAFFSRTGIEKGISIKLLKNIPVAAGMGGGSSDAAATLLALNAIYSHLLSSGELHNLAIQLGADVPFFLYNRPSLITGIGEILKPLKDWPKFWYVIVTPPFKIATSWVYGKFKLQLTKEEDINILDRLKDSPPDLSEIIENDLEQVTTVSFPIINTIKMSLFDAGAIGALMTGSGPSVFGVFQNSDQAYRAKECLISQDMGDVFIATNWEVTDDQ